MIQEPPQSDTLSEGSGSAAFVWFRIFLWIMPTSLVWGLVVIIGWGIVLLRRWSVVSDFRETQGFLAVFGLTGSIVGVLVIAYLDARLKRQQKKISQTHGQFDDAKHVLKFFLFQLALIPCISLNAFAVMEIVSRAAGR